jgi:hypothetical protein
MRAMIASILILAVLLLCAGVQALVIWKNWDRATNRTRFRAAVISLTFLVLANYYVANIFIPNDLDRGSATHGKITPDGHYFVNKRGTYSEVSQAEFEQAFDFEHGSQIAAYFALGAIFAFVIIPKLRPKGPPPPRPQY